MQRRFFAGPHSNRVEGFPVASLIIESPVHDAVDQLIADQEKVFLARQPRSTEMISRAREHLAGGATSLADPVCPIDASATK